MRLYFDLGGNQNKKNQIWLNSDQFANSMKKAQADFCTIHGLATGKIDAGWFLFFFFENSGSAFAPTVYFIQLMKVVKVTDSLRNKERNKKDEFQNRDNREELWPPYRTENVENL